LAWLGIVAPFSLKQEDFLAPAFGPRESPKNIHRAGVNDNLAAEAGKARQK